MKKLFALFLLALMPLMASAYDAEIGGIYYDLDSSGDTPTATVTYKDESYNSYFGDVVIPEFVTYNDVTYSVTTIGYCAFRDSYVFSVTIPNSVTTIGMWAFWSCEALTSVHISSLEAWCNISIDDAGAGFTSPLEYAHHLYLNGEEIKDLVIPNSVTSIPYSAFIGGYFTSITIPNSVTSIGGRAFEKCSSLTSVTIPNSVTSIGNGAFSQCSSLISVTIPNSVTSIGMGAFEFCSMLISVTIPNSVTSIGDCTFSQCSGLTSVTIPNSVTSIGDGAFAGCSLTSITIPNSVTSIGVGAFSQCSSLTSITIPNGVTSISGTTFSGCSSLTSITIPNSVTSIGIQAFLGCSSLTSITIPNSVTSIGDEAFHWCGGLTSITIPNSVTSIGESAFELCNLISVDLPNNLKVIKGKTFKNCPIRSLIIPASVEYIYQEAFADSRSLESVKSLATTPPFLYDNSFSDFDSYYNPTLFVPAASIDSYKTANGWKKFTNILSLDVTKYTLTYIVDGEVYKTYELSEGATITPEPEPTKEGYDFSGWSEIPATMPAHDVTITGSFINESEGDAIKITSAGQTTWCSAYDLDFTDIEGLKAYTAGGYHRTKGTIWLMRVYEVPAGEGILLIGDAGDYKVPHKSTTAYYANLMVGTIEAKTINETDGEYTNYYLSSGASGVGFYKVNGSVDLKANRAYLPLLKNTTSGSRGFIGLDFDDGEEGTTGIEVQSSIFNVQSKDVYYNLQGQRVDNPTKGLYIKNGKKVVIK